MDLTFQADKLGHPFEPRFLEERTYTENLAQLKIANSLSQITKKDTNKLENEVPLSNFSLSHRDKLPDTSPFPSPCKWGCNYG